MKTLIKGGIVVTASDMVQADVLIDGEKIQAVGTGFEGIQADKIIDATGKYVMPGGIDPHTHLDMPLRDGFVSKDDFETGTIAAACGGTTTIIDYPTQEKGKSLFEALENWQEKARKKAVIDYGFHMIMKEFNEDLALEMEKLVEEEGISSFKFFTAYPQALMVDNEQLFMAMKKCGEIGAIPCIHAESGEAIEALIKIALKEKNHHPRYHGLTRPEKTESEAAHRAIVFASMVDSPVFIVHISSALTTDELERAKQQGVAVYGETCPQYLFLDESNYDEENLEGCRYVMCPPLRPKGRQEDLWNSLKKGTIQMIATDHCPFDLQDKKRAAQIDFTKIPNGAPGIETRMITVWQGGVVEGRINPCEYVAYTSTNAAKMFGMYPKKGTIAAGSDADIVILDPDKEQTLSAKTHHMNVDYNLFEGKKVKGWFEKVFSRGELIVENGNYTGEKGRGRYIKRDRFKKL